VERITQNKKQISPFSFFLRRLLGITNAFWTNGYNYIPAFDILNPPTYDASRSDILFLQIHSGDGAHCGAMKITVVSKLWFTDWGTYPIGVSYGVKLTTTFIVPYFVKI